MSIIRIMVNNSEYNTSPVNARQVMGWDIVPTLTIENQNATADFRIQEKN